MVIAEGSVMRIRAVQNEDYSKPDPTRNFDWSEDADGNLVDPRAREFERQVNELIGMKEQSDGDNNGN